MGKVQINTRPRGVVFGPAGKTTNIKAPRHAVELTSVVTGGTSASKATVGAGGA